MKRAVVIIVLVVAGGFLVWKTLDISAASRLAKRIAATPMKHLGTLPAAWAGTGSVPVRLLSELTVHPDRSIRLKTAVLLGSCRDMRAVHALVSLLSDKGPEIRKAAATSLKQLSGRDFDSDPKAWNEWLGGGGRDSLRAGFEN